MPHTPPYNQHVNTTIVHAGYIEHSRALGNFTEDNRDCVSQTGVILQKNCSMINPVFSHFEHSQSVFSLQCSPKLSDKIWNGKPGFDVRWINGWMDG